MASKHRSRRIAFTDEAKRAAGVEPYSIAEVEAKLSAERALRAEAAQAHAKQLCGLVELVRTAIDAYDANRRGEALSILRALVRSKTPGKLALPEAEPPEPRRA